MTNPFFARGNADAVDQVKNLRLAKITNVNTDDMVVDIEFLEESSGKTRVPIPMPSAYPGGGIYSIPKKGALVIVGLRAMQTPVIVAYYPYNAFSPDSFYAISKQVFGIPDGLSEGDIFMRAASDSAKCTVCGVTSLLVAWENNVDPTTLIERCPNCEAPAFVNDAKGLIIQSNKKQLGTTLHMRSDGTIFIQGDNLSTTDDGDTDRLLKMTIDGVSGDITIDEANDINISGNGAANLNFGSLAISSDDTITETANSRKQHIINDSVESAVNRTIQASDTLLATAVTLTLRALGTASFEADGRTETVGKTDSYSAGTVIENISVGRTTTLASTAIPTTLVNDTLSISGSRTVTIGTTLTTTVTGGATISIGGAETVSITGASATTVGGAYSVTSTGVLSLTSSAQMNLTGTSIVFNSGVLPVARKTDATLINNLTDPTFMTFLSGLQAILTDLQTVYNLHTHLSTTPGNPTGPTNAPSTASVPTPPASVTGKINAGNLTVLA